MAKQPRAIMGSKADMISTRYDMVARNEIWRTVVRREREGLAASAAFPAERVAYLSACVVRWKCGACGRSACTLRMMYVSPRSEAILVAHGRARSEITRSRVGDGGCD
jgi:hypothetical protein